MGKRGKVSGAIVLTMNLMSQKAVIASLDVNESSWNDLFYAHPHPGPLPRGEGEMFAAYFGNKQGGWQDSLVAVAARAERRALPSWVIVD